MIPGGAPGPLRSGIIPGDTGWHENCINRTEPQAQDTAMDIASFLNARVPAQSQGSPFALAGGDGASLEGVVPPEAGAAFDRLLEGFLLQQGATGPLAAKEGFGGGKRTTTGEPAQGGQSLWAQAGLVALPAELDIETSPLSREIVAFLNELSHLVTDTEPDAPVAAPAPEDEAADGTGDLMAAVTVTAPLPAPVPPAAWSIAGGAADTDRMAMQASRPLPTDGATQPEGGDTPRVGWPVDLLEQAPDATPAVAGPTKAGTGKTESAPFIAALTAAADAAPLAEQPMARPAPAPSRQGIIPLPFSGSAPASTLPPMPIIGRSEPASSIVRTDIPSTTGDVAAVAPTIPSLALTEPTPSTVVAAPAPAGKPAPAAVAAPAPPSEPSVVLVRQPSVSAREPMAVAATVTDTAEPATLPVEDADPVVDHAPVTSSRPTPVRRGAEPLSGTAEAPAPAPVDREIQSNTPLPEPETTGEHVTNKRMLAPRQNEGETKAMEAGPAANVATAPPRPAADQTVPRPDGVRDALLARAVAAPAEAGLASDDGAGGSLADGASSNASPLTTLHAADAKVQAGDFVQHLRQPAGGRPGQMMPVPHQVAVQVQKAAQDGTDRLSIQLRPLELGRIDVQLDFMAEGTLRARVTAESAQTLDMLQKDAKGLERALEEAGLSVESNGLSFSLRDSGDQAQRGHEREQDGGPGTRNASANVDEEVPATIAEYVPVIGPDRVDVRI